MAKLTWYRVNTEYNWGGSASAPVHNSLGFLSLAKVARVLNTELNDPDTISAELVKYTHDTETARNSCDTKSEIIKKYK